MFQHFKRLGSETVIYGLSSVVSRSLNVILLPFYTRSLSKSELGLVAILTSITSLLTIFTTFGLDNAAHRWWWDSEDLAERKTTVSSWFWTQLAITVFVGLTVLLFRNEISGFLGDGQVSSLIIYYVVTLVTAIPFIVAINVFRLQRKPWLTLVFVSLNTITLLLSNLLCVKFWKNTAEGVAFGTLIASSLCCVISIFSLFPFLFSAKPTTQRIKEMIKFSIPLVPAAFAFWGLGLADRLLVNAYFGKEQVAVYQVGATIAGIVGLATSAFQMAWGPFALSIHTRPESGDIYNKALMIYTIIAGLAMLVVSFFGREIISLVAGANYIEAATVAFFISVASLVGGTISIGSTGLTIVKSVGPIGIGAIFGALSSFMAALILIPWIGLLGPALALLVGQSLYCGIVFWCSQKANHLPYNFIKPIFIFIGFVIVGVASLYLITESTVLIVLSKIVIYLLVSFISIFALYKFFGRTLDPTLH